MPKKNSVSWKRFEKFLLAVGCCFEREKGDHRIFSRSDIERPIVFPRDNPLPLFVIRNNLKLLNISWEEFLNILEKI
ncbi:type II toxin-antitoxin system HicA family toxin [bacterium]|nr:MAG: type II toxin-antitoxin system HicA family toxin [bacterium]